MLVEQYEIKSIKIRQNSRTMSIHKKVIEMFLNYYWLKLFGFWSLMFSRFFLKSSRLEADTADDGREFHSGITDGKNVSW